MSVFSDLNLLRGFVAIVESGSISAAARKLGLSQPTLSRQLRSLEEHCQTALLRRDTHRMSLTDVGHQVLQDAQTLLALADESEQRLRSDQRELSGRIRVFSTIDFGQTVTTRLIASFIQAHPGVQVELGYSNRPLHMIEEGCDAGIVAGELSDERVVARSLGEIRRYPVASAALLKAHTLKSDPAELEALPWIGLAGTRFGDARSFTLHRGEQVHTLQVEPVFITEGSASLREAVRMGLGVAILPEWFIQQDLVARRLLRVMPEWHARPLAASLVHPAQRRMSHRVRAFVEFATDYMRTALR